MIVSRENFESFASITLGAAWRPRAPNGNLYFALSVDTLRELIGISPQERHVRWSWKRLLRSPRSAGTK